MSGTAKPPPGFASMAQFDAAVEQATAQSEASYSLSAEMAEVGRTVARRRRTYPKLIADGKLSQEQADIQLSAMEAVLARLRRISSGK